jgi:hypothetical protein
VSEALVGYHFKQSADGAFAIEADEPCPGVVRLTWKPQEYPGASATIEMPEVLFLGAAQSYLKERGSKPRG